MSQLLGRAGGWSFVSFLIKIKSETRSSVFFLALGSLGINRFPIIEYTYLLFVYNNLLLST